jgi:MscS family membrane protein
MFLAKNERPGIYHHSYSRLIWLWLLFALLAPATFSQSAAWLPQSSQTAIPVAAATPESFVTQSDPLGRDTPRGAVAGFLAAVESHDFDRAGQFLSTSENPDELSELAGQLAYVLNNSHLRLNNLSNRPEGTDQPGLSRGSERIGAVSGEAGAVNIDLSRVQRGQEWIWLFSPETLREIPSAYEFMRDASFDRHLPSFLTRPMWLFVPLWKYLALALGFLVAALAAYALLPSLRRLLLHFFAKQTAAEGMQLVKRIARPLSALVWLAMAQTMVALSGLPLLARARWYEIASKLGIAGFVWLILALVNVTALAYRWRIDRSDSVETMAVVRLIQRTVSFFCIFIGVVLVLRLAGYDVSAFVAGLGVGGLAIAFAAQKTLENLFGGIMLILDKPIRVGDQCRIGDNVATVQDIGLRSTRLRTAERTIMTVPNGQFSTMILDNLTMRDMIQFRHVLGIRMETGVEQLEELMEELRALLATDSMIDPPSCRVRLIRVDGRSLDIELHCMIKTRDPVEFLRIQESLLLQSLRILDARGVSLARPFYLKMEGNAGLSAPNLATGSAADVPPAG